MGSFIVGGFVPGTNIQFSFIVWAVITALLLTMAAFIKLAHKRSFYSAGNVAVRPLGPSTQDLHLAASFSRASQHRPADHQAENTAALSWAFQKVRSLALDIYLDDWTYRQS